MLLLVVLAAIALLLWAEWREHASGIAVFKLTASTGFVVIALASGAWESTYGRWILLALALSWVGDACLLSKRRPWFLTGLTAFLGAHVALIAAFLSRGISWLPVAVATVVLVPVVLVVARWLFSRVEGLMRRAVAFYILAISTMVALGAGAEQGELPVLLVAATMFLVSDLGVARDRFVAPGIVNRLVGLPLYYGAQILFALSPSLLD